MYQYYINKGKLQFYKDKLKLHQLAQKKLRASLKSLDTMDRAEVQKALLYNKELIKSIQNEISELSKISKKELKIDDVFDDLHIRSYLKNKILT